jgi:hypothetical protein
MLLDEAPAVAKPVEYFLSFEQGELIRQKTIVRAVRPFFRPVYKSMLNGVKLNLMEHLRVVSIVIYFGSVKRVPKKASFSIIKAVVRFCIGIE